MKVLILYILENGEKERLIIRQEDIDDFLSCVKSRELFFYYKNTMPEGVDTSKIVQFRIYPIPEVNSMQKVSHSTKQYIDSLENLANQYMQYSSSRWDNNKEVVIEPTLPTRTKEILNDDILNRKLIANGRSHVFLVKCGCGTEYSFENEKMKLIGACSSCSAKVYTDIHRDKLPSKKGPAWVMTNTKPHTFEEDVERVKLVTGYSQQTSYLNP